MNLASFSTTALKQALGKMCKNVAEAGFWGFSEPLILNFP
jgi:hypothetical protein